MMSGLPAPQIMAFETPARRELKLRSILRLRELERLL